MSFSFRQPAAKPRRRPAPWSFWLWSGGAWVVIASAVFRGDATAPGPGLATWGPVAGAGDALVAGGGPAPGLPLISSAPQPVRLPGSLTEQAPPAAQAGTLAERSSRWRSLLKELREFIDSHASDSPRWLRLVVDEFGDPSGNAADLAFQRGNIGSGDPAPRPHFVIGNGSRSDDGRIEATGRPLADESLLVVQNLIPFFYPH